MAKGRSWFCSLKWLCIPRGEQGDPVSEEPYMDVEQRKHSYAVAMATDSALEAATAAANAVAEIIRLIHIPCQIQQLAAAIKIQSSYRRHIARKVLGALKGIVKLQALIRGDLLRKHILIISPSFKSQHHKSHNRGIRLEEEKRRIHSNRVVHFEENDKRRLKNLKLKHGEDKNGAAAITSPARRSCSHVVTKSGRCYNEYWGLESYMAATESTKAKSRSLSLTPRRRNLCYAYAQTSPM